MTRTHLVWRRKLDGTVISTIEDLDTAAIDVDWRDGFVAVPVQMLGGGRISIAPAYMQRLRDFLSPPSADDAPAVRP